MNFIIIIGLTTFILLCGVLFNVLRIKRRKKRKKIKITKAFTIKFKTLRIGVIGAGAMGTFLSGLVERTGAKIVVVHDIKREAAEKLANERKGAIATTELNKLFDTSMDGLIVCTIPTARIEPIKRACEKNIHLFIEKPFTRSLTEAQNIIRMEKTTGLKIQIGHIERFNAAFLNYLKKGPAPQFVESHRLCKYNKRGLDVDVVLDLMIHDIDILLLINPFPIKSICASGASILTTSLDMASVRVEFKNNVSANLTASRISLKQMRQMRIFATSSYNIIDFQNQSWKKWCIENKAFKEQTIKIAPNNALYEELNLFIKSIHKDLSIKVGTRETIKALTVACQIQKIIEKK